MIGVPSTIPKLVRPGAPVIVARFPEYHIDRPFRAVLYDEAQDFVEMVPGWRVAFGYGGYTTHDLHEVPATDVSLNLDDPFGQALAGWWLRDWLERDEDKGAPNYALLPSSERFRLRVLIRSAEGGRADPELLQRVLLHVAQVAA